MDKLEIELFCIAATAGIRFDDAVRMKRLLGYLSTTSQHNYDQVRKNYLKGDYMIMTGNGSIMRLEEMCQRR